MTVLRRSMPEARGAASYSASLLVPRRVTVRARRTLWKMPSEARGFEEGGSFEGEDSRGVMASASLRRDSFSARCWEKVV
jgi:hypothetical protein